MPEHPSSEKEIIHREFELERVILFSDAVFAIAITLLIIDVKFPDVPEDRKNLDYWVLFKPTILAFIALIVSFFFIGNFWLKHLKLFKFLKNYDTGLVVRNLFFLFFIVVFPFAAEGLAAHFRPSFLLPLFVYMINIALCSCMHTMLCNYMFFKKPQLSITAHEAEKKYIYLVSKYFSITLIIITIIASVVNILSSNNSVYVSLTFDLLAIGAIIINRKLKKLKPKKEEQII